MAPLPLPPRFRSILLGLSLGLFLSALFASTFSGKIVPLSSPNSFSIPAQLYFFFFRGSSPSLDRHAPQSVYLSPADPHRRVPRPADTARSSLPRQFGDEDGRRMPPRSDGDSRTASARTGDRMWRSSSGKDDGSSSAKTEAFRQNPTDNRHKRDRPAALKEAQGPNYTNASPSAPVEDRTLALGSDSVNINASIAKDASDEKSVEVAVTGNASVEVRTNNDNASLQGQGDRHPNNSFSQSTDPPKRSGSRCDLCVGSWVQDDSYPLYHPGSCPYVDEGFSCHRNGRLDTDYTRWRWVPRHCAIPRMNGTHMLEKLRGKRLVFVGDSLNRNQWESLLCLLRESLADKNRIVEVHGGRISKLPGAYVFKFLDYDCRVEFYTSHFLVDEELEGEDPTKFTVTLDRIDKSERRWRKANVLVFNTGHWWTPDKIGEGNNCFREGEMVHAKMDVMVAYRKAIETWARWVDRCVNPANTRVFFRGYSPAHYLGGQWNSGGQCHTETLPIFNELFLTPYPDKMQVVEDIIPRMRVPVQILNITRLSDFRKDAHPAIYGHRPQDIKDYQDCSHWCLPGLPDTWNELLYSSLFFHG